MQSTQRTDVSHPTTPPRSRRWWLTAAGGLIVLSLGAMAWAQPGGEPDPGEPSPAPITTSPAATGKITADWKGAIRILRLPGAGGTAESKAKTEIFPGADKVWMHVEGPDAQLVEAVRRGSEDWVCSQGCSLDEATTTTGATTEGNAMLRSIKAQTPMQPMPLTIWRPKAQGGTKPDTFSKASTTGKLLFDPKLLGRRSYRHVCAYPPVKKRAAPGSPVKPCPQRKRSKPSPDQAKLTVGFAWPEVSELADFEYLAIVDSCGNARVQPFHPTFTAPVYLVSTGSCTKDGRVLRVFPAGGSLRVTAFNLKSPAAGSVVSVTFRVKIPAFEDLVSADRPPMLFPDPSVADLVVDCGPPVLKALPGPGGMPRRPPGAIPPGAKPPTGPVPPGAKPPAKPTSGPAPTKPPSKVPITGRTRHVIDSTPTGKPLAQQGLVIGPEPLLRGACRLEMKGQIKRRLITPMALRVILRRTDESTKVGGESIIDEPWIITPRNSTFEIPPLQGKIDGESRLRLEVYSDPRSPDGNMVLLSDAARLARIENIASVKPEEVRRLIGWVTIYSAPLCGDANFVEASGAGSCFRGYFTVPAMLATIQVTRAPWVETPIITRSILNAVGVAFAMDSYDPVEREAFPIAAHIGGFVQTLDDNHTGLLVYAGVAPTMPILGEGGNTTSVGILGGIGLEYIMNSSGPDEGFKPAAFLSVVVQVGQANPALGGTQDKAFTE